MNSQQRKAFKRVKGLIEAAYPGAAVKVLMKKDDVLASGVTRNPDVAVLVVTHEGVTTKVPLIHRVLFNDIMLPNGQGGVMGLFDGDIMRIVGQFMRFFKANPNAIEEYANRLQGEGAAA